MQINRNEFPLNVLKDLQYFYSTASTLLESNDDSIINLARNYHFLLKDISGDFYYKVIEIKTGPQGKAELKLEYKPAGPHTVAAATVNVPSQDAIKRLKDWIGIVREYSKLVVVPEDESTLAYETEFQNLFTPREDDSDMFLKYDEQLIIEKVLLHIEQQVNSLNEAGKEEIIGLTRKLKQDIPNLNKKQVGKNLSKIFAVMRKHGSKALEIIFETIVKEGVSVGFRMLIDTI